METVILYYTFGGSTKKEAERLAKELNAPLYPVKESRNRNFVSAFVPGGFLAMRRKSTPIRPLNVDLNKYDRIIVGSPVWAGYPAPAFNSILEMLPAGKKIELFLCSGGGDTSKSRQGTIEWAESKGCTVLSYRDVSTGTPPGKSKE